MTSINVIEYPEEGFAILEDSAGKYLVFRDTDEITDIEFDIGISNYLTKSGMQDILIKGRSSYYPTALH